MILGWLIMTSFLSFQHRVYTLLAIVCIFILCNLLPTFLITADMVNFNTITVCKNFDDPDNRGLGYSTVNTIITNIGMTKDC